MFGCILAGQSVQTNFEAVSDTDLLLRLDNLQSSFLTIFMTGEKPFPDGLAGAIYISIPAGQGETECWSYLGHVSNQKPSGTFKIDNLKRMAQQNINSFGSNNYAGPQIGISVKTINEIENFTPGKLSKLTLDYYKTRNSAVSMDASSMVKNMAENLFNFCSSFASGDSSSVPISTIEMWFRNTQQKLAQNPNLFKK